MLTNLFQTPQKIIIQPPKTPYSSHLKPLFQTHPKNHNRAPEIPGFQTHKNPIPTPQKTLIYPQISDHKNPKSSYKKNPNQSGNKKKNPRHECQQLLRVHHFLGLGFRTQKCQFSLHHCPKNLKQRKNQNLAPKCGNVAFNFLIASLFCQQKPLIIQVNG